MHEQREEDAGDDEVQRHEAIVIAGFPVVAAPVWLLESHQVHNVARHGDVEDLEDGIVEDGMLPEHVNEVQVPRQEHQRVQLLRDERHAGSGLALPDRVEQHEEAGQVRKVAEVAENIPRHDASRVDQPPAPPCELQTELTKVGSMVVSRVTAGAGVEQNEGLYTHWEVPHAERHEQARWPPQRTRTGRAATGRHRKKAHASPSEEQKRQILQVRAYAAPRRRRHHHQPAVVATAGANVFRPQHAAACCCCVVVL